MQEYMSRGKRWCISTVPSCLYNTYQVNPKYFQTEKKTFPDRGIPATSLPSVILINILPAMSDILASRALL